MKLYIAYGSNLNLKQMQQRCPNSRPVETAMLRNYELEFRGVATIVPKKNAVVPVLLWQISPQDERNLDRYEGFPNLYRKETYEIDLDRHKVSGMAYVMNGGQIAAPNIHYYCTIAQGYRENHLNLEYLNAAVERAAEFQNNLIETDDFQIDLT